jgi:uncharacterized protein (DUF1501 family)
MKRRDFLRLLGGVTSVPLMGPLSELAFGAGPFDDYRALVCVFMYGGNDAHNMIVPLDGRYAAYAANRGPLALPKTSLQSNSVTDPAQGSFGFHPRMTRSRDLFAAGRLAVVSNVGVLLRPTTKFDFQNRTQLPPQLFSHNDNQDHWFTCRPQVAVSTGWGGRLADLLQPANTGGFAVGISAAGSGVMLKGNAASAHQVLTYNGTGNPPRPITRRIRSYGSFDTTQANPQGVYENAITMARANVLEDQFGDAAARAVEVNDFILKALYDGPEPSGPFVEKFPLKTAFPADNPLAMQLRSVAMMIAGRQALGVKRQVFFVSPVGLFDTHSDQFDTTLSPYQPAPGEPAILYGKHADLLLQVDVALKAFYDATVELGVQNSVTTFTGSDFGRTLTSNAKGSDHGWGAHHLVLGGAVKGGKIYGTFHNMQIGTGNPVDAGQGRLIPDCSVDQYAATLSKWMGASAADLNVVFPNLANFPQTDLGFIA